jgi:virulence-associated protein VapD
MYALAFDLDTTVLAAQYHNASWTNAYKQIRATLEARSFVWIQQSLYHVRAGLPAAAVAAPAAAGSTGSSGSGAGRP